MYILVVDDEIEICDIFEMTIRSAFQHQVEIANSGEQALSIIESKGKPEVIISDYRMPQGDGLFLYKELKNRNIATPFIICSGDPIDTIKELFPNAHGHVQKPFILEPILELLKATLRTTQVRSGFVPIRIGHLLRLGEVHSDLYMKLGQGNYVKVIHQGESFLMSDAERFEGKQLTHLYINEKDANAFLRSFEMNFGILMGSKRRSTEQKMVLSLEGMEVIDKLSRTLGWKPEVLATAKKCIDLALVCVSTNPDVLAILNKQNKTPDAFYSQHSGPLAMVSAVFCQQLGWVSESSQMKLAMASLMHDMTLSNEFMEKPAEWISRARNKADSSMETVKYRNHPIEAAQLIQTIKNLPPDIDQIILQHHESPDAKGFPRGLTSGRISPMSAVFIISEDLVNFILDDENLEEKIKQFVESREKVYVEGNFKRVFQALKANLITHH